MLINEKIFDVSLTAREVELITEELHRAYTETKESAKIVCADGNGKLYGELNNKANELRILRNEMASLIDRRYMGEDA